ncbi:MAG: hypothetical protein IJL42_05775 [Bacteroidales bacterium]|nr:hypothetical protein [Bacteroidales bacterium]MBR1699689.1 hypothetical protein [Bacteroidales bacterium]
MKYYLPLLLLLAASACGTVRTLPVQDSTRVEVRVVEKTVRDTAWVELPVIIEKRTTLDTASVLENKYAKSEAAVSGGVLIHSLSTKPVREPVAVETKELVRDSIVYRDRIQTQTVEVEKKLSWWQTLQMRLGLVTILLLVIVVIYSIFLIINHFKS